MFVCISYNCYVTDVLRQNCSRGKDVSLKEMTALQELAKFMQSIPQCNTPIITYSVHIQVISTKKQPTHIVINMVSLSAKVPEKQSSKAAAIPIL